MNSSSIRAQIADLENINSRLRNDIDKVNGVSSSLGSVNSLFADYQSKIESLCNNWKGGYTIDDQPVDLFFEFEQNANKFTGRMVNIENFVSLCSKEVSLIQEEIEKNDSSIAKLNNDLAIAIQNESKPKKQEK